MILKRDTKKMKSQLSIQEHSDLSRNISRIACFVAVLVFASCERNHSVFSDKDVFRYNEHSNVTTLDPAFARDQRNIWPANLLYNGLVQLDDSLNVKPSIAASWMVSDDAKTYTLLIYSILF